MKNILKITLILFVTTHFSPKDVCGQAAIKTNIPLTLIGTPNLGVEFTVGKNMAVSADVLWAPYMWKSSSEVLRSFQASAELRYYLNPRYYYSNDMYDGIYIGPYALWGDFNVGFKESDTDDLKNFRREGWGVSAGASFGYKLFLSRRLKLDLNLGIGYAHMQYDKYYLGGEWADHPLEIKKTRGWVGPTKFGISLVYSLVK